MSRQHRHSESHRHGDLQVITCEDCGFRHLWPLPSMEELQETYEKRFGGDVRPQFRERKREDVAHWERVFDRRLVEYRRILPNVEKPRVLDIGCGVGDFLAYCKAQDFEVWGVEPSSHFHGELERKGIKFIPKLIENITPEQWQELGAFDIVNMSMFLEHVYDPVATVLAATKHLVAGGILSIECPNDFNPLQRAAVATSGEQNWWISPLHINYFDFDSLEALCNQINFTPVHRTTQFPLEMFILFGDSYVGNDALGREMHAKRMKFEQALGDSGHSELLKDLYDEMAKLGVGRQATIYALKNE